MTGRFFPWAVKGLVRVTLSGTSSFSTLPRLSILPIWFTLAGKYLIACARCTQISTAVRIAIEAACVTSGVGTAVIMTALMGWGARKTMALRRLPRGGD